MNVSETFAKYLLEINAVKLNVIDPFTWTSGIVSPIYCDNRVTLSYPKIRDFIKTELKVLYDQHFKADILGGIATAGIAHGALLSDILQMPYCYVRPEPKKHGLKNQIEGYMAPNSKVVLIEDLISTGKSSMQAAQGVRLEGGIVSGILALFSYGFEDASNLFKKENIPVYTISNFSVLANVAKELSYVTAHEYEQIQLFIKNPNSWK